MASLDIIVLLIVVALIFQRLWRVLGSNPENNAKRIQLSREGAQKLYNLLRDESEKSLREAAQNAVELKPLEDESSLSDVEKVLRKIPDFNKNVFLGNAKKAFQVITDAFNNSDAATLQMLVDKKIYDNLAKIIKQRQDEGLLAETEFICFDKAEIIRAEINKKNTALIGVEFVTEQVNILRNKDGNVIQGDENFVQTITDVWTFARAIDSQTPNWMLISTKK